MRYKLVQLWYQLTCPFVAMCEHIHDRVADWLEWQDAKCWAKDYHPAWLQMATKCKRKETKQYYRKKILAAYRTAVEMIDGAWNEVFADGK